MSLIISNILGFPQTKSISDAISHCLADVCNDIDDGVSMLGCVPGSVRMTNYWVRFGHLGCVAYDLLKNYLFDRKFFVIVRDEKGNNIGEYYSTDINIDWVFPKTLHLNPRYF